MHFFFLVLFTLLFLLFSIFHFFFSFVMRSRAIYFLLWFSSREGRTTNEAMSEAVPHRWLRGRGLIVDFRVLLTCIQFQAGKHTQKRSSNFVTVRFFICFTIKYWMETKPSLFQRNNSRRFFHRLISDRKWQWNLYFEHIWIKF